VFLGYNNAVSAAEPHRNSTVLQNFQFRRRWEDQVTISHC